MAAKKDKSLKGFLGSVESSDSSEESAASLSPEPKRKRGTPDMDVEHDRKIASSASSSPVRTDNGNNGEDGSGSSYF